MTIESEPSTPVETIVPQAPTAASCPRCGYDQRGFMSTWRDSCPLRGTCSECGLEFHFSEVLHPEKYEPQWCIEYVPRMRPVKFVRAWLGTYLRALWPWRFWRSLQMSHPIRWRRIAIFVLTPLFTALPLYVLIQGGAAVMARRFLVSSLQQQVNAVTAQQANYQSQLNNLQAQSSEDPAPKQTDQPPSNAAEMRYFASTDDMRARRQQMIGLLQTQLATIQQWQKTPPAVNASDFEAALEALLHPTGSFSSLKITYPTIGGPPGVIQQIPYIAPNTVWNVVLNSSSGAWMAGGNPMSNRTLRHGAGWGLFYLVMMLMLPASLVLLPVSRRKAKVRWSHIVRVTLYGVHLPFTLLVAASILLLLVVLLGGTASAGFWNSTLVAWIMLLTIPAALALLVCWWGAAINRYLKIPHGHFTAAVLLIMCGLMYAAVLYLIDPRTLIG